MTWVRRWPLERPDTCCKLCVRIHSLRSTAIYGVGSGRSAFGICMAIYLLSVPASSTSVLFFFFLTISCIATSNLFLRHRRIDREGVAFSLYLLAVYRFSLFPLTLTLWLHHPSFVQRDRPQAQKRSIISYVSIEPSLPCRQDKKNSGSLLEPPWKLYTNRGTIQHLKLTCCLRKKKGLRHTSLFFTLLYFKRQVLHQLS